jgi:hypothetical protein
MTTTVYKPAASSTGDSSITGDLTVTGDGTVTQDLTIDTNTLYVDSANNRVGVGTVTPVRNLQVHGSGTVGVQYTNGDTGATNADGFLVGINSLEEAQIYNFENTDMIFANNNGVLMRLENGGNLGLGTDSPDVHFHMTDATGAAFRFESSSTGTVAGDSVGQIEWEGNDASGSANGIRGTINGQIQDNFGGMYFIFSLAPNSNVVADVAELDYNGNLDLYGDTLRIRTAKTPTSATDTGSTGQIAWDTGFIYVCTATNTWERVAIATW